MNLIKRSLRGFAAVSIGARAVMLVVASVVSSVVVAGPATHFCVSAPASVTAGSASAHSLA